MDGEGLRPRIERASSPLLEALGRRRLLLPAMLLVAVPVSLLFTGRWAAMLGLFAVLVIAWLTYLAWSHLSPAGRALRLLVLLGYAAWLVLGG